MIKNQVDTQKIKENIDLISIAQNSAELRKCGPKEWAGPCPKCGGTDRFHVAADWFFCRQCHEKRGDAIEFMQWLNGVDFKAAVDLLTNAPVPSQAAPRRPQARQAAPQVEEWGPRAQALAEHCHARLMNSGDADAAAGRRYLDGRQLEPHAWQAFKLGYTPSAALPGTKGQLKAPAIVLPWFRAGKVVAIRYRFLDKHTYTDADGKARTEKQTALAGSSFAGILYGGQAIRTHALPFTTLLITEGELNAISIWQTCQDTNLNVLSMGSESAHITPAMGAHAAQYERVLIWMDKGDRARAAQESLPGAYGIQSPNGQDANDLLQAGTLGGFVAMHRFNAARSKQSQERILWDIWEAAQMPGGVDASTNEVIQHIAKVLERSL